MQALRFRRTSRSRRTQLRRVGCALAAAVVTIVLVGAAPAADDNYDVKHSGHPLRVLAYVTHPIGVILHTLIFRPAHWIASHEPLKTIFGQID